MGKHTISRFAAVDIGSNAVRLLLCNVVNENRRLHYNKSELIRVPLRLGEDAFLHQRISAYKARRFLKVMKAFKLLIDVFEPVSYKACATAALREAVNGKELVRKVMKECGMKIDIISGKKEAKLIYANHVEEQLAHDKSYLYIDVGGGSTEITLFHGGKCIDSKSFNIGTIRFLQETVTKDAWEDMKGWVRTITAHHQLQAAIGSGGNINKINKLIGGKDKPLNYVTLRKFYGEIKELSVDQRIDFWELNPDRADVIVPAARIFLAIMKAARVRRVLVPGVGLSDGIIHDLYESRFPGKRR